MSRLTRLTLILLVAIPVAAQQIADSPLVALAKRTGRLGKIPKSQVITNDDLARYRGRMSEPAGDEQASAAQTNAAPAAVGEWARMEAVRAERTAQEAQYRAAIATAAPQVEGTSRASYSNVQSSTLNTSLGSTAASSTGLSSVRATGMQSSATSSNYNQTAPSSSLPPVQPRKVE